MSETQHGVLRKFNRAVINPITKLFAGNFIYALVFHKGRRSGKAYSTPVVAVKKGQYIYCPLPYGMDTDWYLNIKAAGQCEVKLRGVLYSAMSPEVIEQNVALSIFSSGLRKAFIKAKIEKYIQLRIIG